MTDRERLALDIADGLRAVYAALPVARLIADLADARMRLARRTSPESEAACALDAGMIRMALVRRGMPRWL